MAELKSLGFNAEPKNGMYSGGKKMRQVHSQFSLASGDTAANDILILADDLALGDRVHRIFAVGGIAATAGASDNDIGFYSRDGEGNLVALDAGNELLDGGSFTSTVAAGDLIASGTDRTKNVADLAGVNRTADYGDIVLGMKLNSNPTAALAMDLDIVVEEATVS